MIMKTKFVLLVAAGLFLASASQAQFPGSYKDSREVNRDRHEMTYRKNMDKDHRELRKDRRDIRYDRRQLKKDRRLGHHHHHHHRHAHRVF
jgi:hypothetical protein